MPQRPPRSWSSSRSRSPCTCSSADPGSPSLTARHRMGRTIARARSPRSQAPSCRRRCTSRIRSSHFRAALNSQEGLLPADCTCNSITNTLSAILNSNPLPGNDLSITFISQSKEFFCSRIFLFFCQFSYKVISLLRIFILLTNFHNFIS